MQLLSQFRKTAKCNILRQQLVSQYFVAASVVESRTWSYFSQRLQHLPSVQLVSQCFARSANQDPYYPLLGPPRSQFCELLAVPLHSVTLLFVQLQCYALKRCEISCTKTLPSLTATLLIQNMVCVCSLLHCFYLFITQLSWNDGLPNEYSLVPTDNVTHLTLLSILIREEKISLL